MSVAELCVARSRSLPLGLKADFTGYIPIDDGNVMKVLLRTLNERVRRLHLLGIPFRHLKAVTSVLPPMPILADISIEVDIPPEGNTLILPESVTDLLKVEGGLARLSLYECLAPRLSEIMSSTLTHVTLVMSSPHFHAELPDVDGLVQMLSRLSQLHELCLHGMPARAERGVESIGTGRSKCSLPKCFRLLQYTTLDMNNSTECALEFLSCLKAPLGAEIAVDVYQDGAIRRSATEFSQVTAAARAMLDCGDLPWTLDLTYRAVRMKIGDVPLGSGSKHSTIIVRRCKGPLGEEGNIAEVIHRLPLKNLSAIKFGPEAARYCFSSENGIVSRLLDARDVSKVTVRLRNGMHLIKALGSVHTSSKRTLFPNLSKVTIREYPDPFGIAERPDRAIKALGATCAHRNDMGHGLSEVHIDERYRALVCQISWGKTKVRYVQSRTGWTWGPYFIAWYLEGGVANSDYDWDSHSNEEWE